MRKPFIRLAGAVAMSAFLGVGCTNGTNSLHHMASTTMVAAAQPAATTPAAELRTGLNALLQEHVILAAAATGAALGGRNAEFEAATGALDANSVDIARAIGAVYGAGAEQAFLPLWRKHIGFVVDYTVGVATPGQGQAGQGSE